MRLNLLYIAGCVLLACGCSHPAKKTGEVTPPVVSSAATTSPGTVQTSAASTQVASTSATPQKPEEKKDGMTCKRGKELRTLQVELSAPKGCQLWYSKDGHRTAVASSALGPAHCEKVRSKMGDTLKNAGFECVTTETLSNEPAAKSMPKSAEPAAKTAPAAAVSPAHTATPAASAKPAASPVVTAKPVASPSPAVTAKPAASPSPAATAKPQPSPAKK